MAEPWKKYQPAAGGDPWQKYDTPDAPAPSGGENVFVRAAKNAPGSAGRFVRDTIAPFAHPVETAESLYSLGKGVLQLAKPGTQPEEAAVHAVGKFFSDRYGSFDRIKETFATDPVGILADVGTVLSAGGGLAARAPGMAGRVSRVAKTVGDVVDPASLALKSAGKVATVASPMLTGAGIPATATAMKAGREGGEAARMFRRNLRGRAPMDEVVNSARSAVENLRLQKSAAYERGMRGISRDTTVIDFSPIQASLDAAKNKGRFKGVPISRDTEGVLKSLDDIVTKWGTLDPAQFHTPQGLDALKQAIGNLGIETKRGTIEGRIISDAYNAVKGEIVKQAPAYAKVMEDYTVASELLRDIEHGFGTGVSSFGNKESSLRKLQSIMRNNANTNYGRRAELGAVLESAGATHLPEQLAGQQMQAVAPRGLQSLLVGGAGLGGVALDPRLLATIPFMSPRLAGEAFYYSGKAGPMARGLLDTSFQTGRQQEGSENVGN